MEILSVCAAGVVSAVLALLLRRQSPQISLLISVGAGAVILLAVIDNTVLASREISSVLSSAGISSDCVMILLKALGICFVTEFTCDTVTEAGLVSLSANLSFVGKILVLITALPLFREVITLVSSMVAA